MQHKKLKEIFFCAFEIRVNYIINVVWFINAFGFFRHEKYDHRELKTNRTKIY